MRGAAAIGEREGYGSERKGWDAKVSETEPASDAVKSVLAVVSAER
jgi:hypothetical protein